MSTSSKHVHYDKIAAKINNMTLVVFYNDPEHGWVECMEDFIDMHPDVEYFLCIPKHKKEVLHWINGGHEDVECNSKFTKGWTKCSAITWVAWNPLGGYMREDATYRIKPRKVKRWIAYNDKNKQLGAQTFGKEDMARSVYPEADQFIEIEIEMR